MKKTVPIWLAAAAVLVLAIAVGVLGALYAGSQSHVTALQKQASSLNHQVRTLNRSLSDATDQVTAEQATADACLSAYQQQSTVTDRLRTITSDTMQALVDFFNAGGFDYQPLTTALNTGTDEVGAVNTAEDAIDASSCTGAGGS